MKKSRRNLLAGAMAAGALAPVAPAQGTSQKKKVIFRGERPANPLFPSATVHGNMVYVSGHGFNDVEGIKAQTKKLLDEIEKILQMAGSSMENVLKCNVYLADIRDYAAMNEVYRGRFGADPPARTTLAIANIPLKDCLVEIECIAFI